MYWLPHVHIPGSPKPQSLRFKQGCLSLEDKLDCHGVIELVLGANANSQSVHAI